VQDEASKLLRVPVNEGLDTAEGVEPAAAAEEAGREPEIDVDKLMREIREASAQQAGEATAPSLAAAAASLRTILSGPQAATPQEHTEPVRREPDTESAPRRPETEPTELQPLEVEDDFRPRADKRYHVSELLKYHDAAFVRCAYRALLCREPDEGSLFYLSGLRDGRLSKLDLISSLLLSPEGRESGVRVEGLPRRSMERLYRLPVLGYALQIIVGVVRLPALIRNQSRFEVYSIARQQESLERQQEALRRQHDDLMRQHYAISEQRDAVEQVKQTLAETLARQQDSMRRLTEAYREATHLLHQQISALFREQNELIDEQSTLRREVYTRLAEAGGSGHASVQPPPAAAHEEGEQLDRLYYLLEERFRGSRAEVKERFRIYLPMLREAAVTGDILDVGCGRGEWLELLRDEGVRASGVDSNRVMIEQCRRLGLEVSEAGVLEYLRRLPDASLNAVTGFHIVEHFSFEALLELLDEVRRVLKRGGLVIFETPNPENILVGSCNFYLDPTHRHPLPKLTLQFLLEAKGLERVRLIDLHPWSEERIAGEGALVERFNKHFYGPMDYAILGFKP
jgi:O-antigen chain-terminating methyltransferase